MPAPYVDTFTVLVLRASGELFELFDVESKDLEVTKTKNRVMRMGRNRRPAGFRSGIVEASGTIEYQLSENPEVPWEAMFQNNEILQLLYKEGSGGRRFQAIDVEIESFSKSGNAEGDVTMSVSWQGLDYVEQRPLVS